MKGIKIQLIAINLATIMVANKVNKICCVGKCVIWHQKQNLE